MTTTTMTMNTTTYTDVSLLDFVNHETDGHDDCIHVVPEEGGITFLRLVESVSEGADENVRVKTTLDGRFRTMGDRRPEYIIYHGAQAATVLLWLRSLARERGEATVSADYWEVNNSPALDEAGVANESLFLSYTVGDRTEEAQINDVYTTAAHMSASFS